MVEVVVVVVVLAVVQLWRSASVCVLRSWRLYDVVVEGEDEAVVSLS